MILVAGQLGQINYVVFALGLVAILLLVLGERLFPARPVAPQGRPGWWPRRRIPVRLRVDAPAFFKLPPSLAVSDQTTSYYSPTNWAYLDSLDMDLGGTGPLLVDVPGAMPSELVVALGKDQFTHVVDRNNLGGITAPVEGSGACPA